MVIGPTSVKTQKSITFISDKALIKGNKGTIGNYIYSYTHNSSKLHANSIQESCAIAKMTARCSLYKWIE